MVNNTVPLYQQMLNVLIHQIEVGNLKENDKLPSEQELGEKFNISRITVRKALEELQNRNFIYKKQGQGSFVLSRKQRNRHYKYWDIYDKISEMGTNPSSKIDEFNIIADKKFLEIKHSMGLSDFDYLYQINETYFSDNDKVMYLEVFMAYNRFPQITLDELENENIIPLLAGKYNFVDGKYITTTKASLVDREDKKFLDANIHDPKIIITKHGFDNDRLVFIEKAQVVGFLPMYLDLE